MTAETKSRATINQQQQGAVNIGNATAQRSKL